ncbi:DsrE family protein [Novosphingobium sp. SG707]|uniref:DsrE family protein n=1 Tax=Novosphingobium sp. SG707 TaxID=2586996 RepID=UPI001447E551|nr:DsrE family protein [Novosphingobium sp. SG707]NKI98235.1 intracellular sulfur oxidation DsrE/DsrF family protein [Novosphingobium sp. SG707]
MMDITLRFIAILGALGAPLAAHAAEARVWPAPTPPAIAGSNGYVEIPGAAVARDPKRSYKALFSAATGASDPAQTLPAFGRVASQLNGLIAAKVPASHISFAMILYGAAADAVLSDAEYRKKYNIDNPNKVIFNALRQAGVRMMVCGQWAAGRNIARDQLLPGIEVAEAATLVQITYANDGYAVLNN